MIFIKLMLLFKIFFLGSLALPDKTVDFKDKEFRELAAELRCLVCQNQSLLDSDSDLANDLKEVIYEQLSEGKNKYEIKEYLVKRYGEFILFKPLFNETNFLLWLSPLFSILIIGLIGFRKTRIKKKK